MAKFPLLPARKVINALIRLGYSIDHQKGSHIVLKNTNEQRTIVVPDHDELDRGTLKAILKQAGIDIEDLLSLLTLICYCNAPRMGCKHIAAPESNSVTYHPVFGPL
jgi:predicted RNA binding protein YcfA (HicA-like mRNA interferase family)